MNLDNPLLGHGNSGQMGPAVPVTTYVNAAVGLAAGPALVGVLALADQLSWPGVLAGLALSSVMGRLGMASGPVTSRR
jgi:hypothetical protein